jgi:hypothetical protein
VSAPGHQAQKRTLVLDRPLDLKIDLEPVSDGPAPTAAPTSEPAAASTARPAVRKPTVGGEPRPTPTATPTSGGGIKIDEQNPYAQ